MLKNRKQEGACDVTFLRTIIDLLSWIGYLSWGCLSLSWGCLGLSRGCLGLSLGCLGLRWWCLCLSWGCLGLSWGCLGLWRCVSVSRRPQQLPLTPDQLIGFDNTGNICKWQLSRSYVVSRTNAHSLIISHVTRLLPFAVIKATLQLITASIQIISID